MYQLEAHWFFKQNILLFHSLQKQKKTVFVNGDVYPYLEIDWWCGWIVLINTLLHEILATL